MKPFYKHKYPKVILILIIILSPIALFSIPNIHAAEGDPEFTYTFYDYPVDSDGNGKYDYLVIIAEINATFEGFYEVYIHGLIDYTWTWVLGDVENTSQSVYLTPGIHNISVYLPGTEISRYEIDGPYCIYWGELRCNSTLYDYAYLFGVSLTQPYNYTDFEGPPNITTLIPQYGAHLTSDSVIFSWKTDTNCSTEVYLRRIGYTMQFTKYLGEWGTDHYCTVGGLPQDSNYEWYVASNSTRGFRTESAKRIFFLGHGITFSNDIYNYTIDRDYDQQVSVSVRNFDTVSHQLLLSVESPYPDLILGFIGNGSIDKVITLDSLEIISAQLAIHAQDAMQENYLINLKLINLAPTPEEDNLTDYALLDLSVDQTNVDFGVTEIDDDPETLTKTFNLTNYGDTLTDFRVYADANLSKKIDWNPKINHYRLETGDSIVFQARLNVDWTFLGTAAGLIFVKAYNTVKNISVTYQGQGELFYGGTDASFFQLLKDWYCTNKPTFDMQFDVISDVQGGFEGTMTSVTGDVEIGGQSAGLGDEIDVGDTITTGSGSEAEITLSDGSKITIDENSVVTVKPQSPPRRSSRSEFEIAVGKIWYEIVSTINPGAGTVDITTISNDATGTRGTRGWVAFNNATLVMDNRLFEGHIDIFHNNSQLYRAMATDPTYNLTYDLVRQYNGGSGLFDLVFRNSTDFGASWLHNQTLFSSADLANITMAVGPNHTLMVLYEVSGTINCIISSNNGTDWSAPIIIADDTASAPYICASTQSEKMYIGWLNGSTSIPDHYFREINTTGQLGIIKRGPTYIMNALDAYVQVDFGLPWLPYREEYRKHDVEILLNGHRIIMVNQTIPEGTYLFPIDLNYFNYGVPGQSGTNTLTFNTFHLNGGHYVVTTDAKIIIRLADLDLLVFAESQEEADQIALNVTTVNFNMTDIGSYVNFIEAPSAMTIYDNTKINATVINLGDNPVSNIDVQFFLGDPEIGGTQIGSNQTISNLAAGDQATVGINWAPPSTGSHYIFVKTNCVTDDNEQNNVGFVQITVLGPNDAPIVTVTYPNASERVNDTFYITWTAEDPNADPITYSLYYGNEYGWVLIADDITDNYYEWNTYLIPDGQYKILVIASDGYFTTNDTSDEFFTVGEPNGGGGIPSFKLLPIIFGIAFSLALFQLQQKKKRKPFNGACSISANRL